MTPARRPAQLRWRVWGRYHRDARSILAISIATGIATSLWWIDFNLYLAAIGLSTATIGLIATLANLAGGLVAFPASAFSDRLGRRAVLGGSLVASVAGLGLLVAAGDAVPVVVAAAMLWSAGVAAFAVVIPPLLTERSTPEHRNDLFALQSAIQSATSVGAAVLGSVVALLVTAWLNVGQQDLAVYRVILLAMAALLAVGLAVVRLLADDRPAVLAARRLRQFGEPAPFPVHAPRVRPRLGITILDRGRFARLVLPGFLISIGAGAVIPFLNLFVKGKFGLDLAQVNAVFALTSLGTVVAVLVQPRLARRFGQIRSVVLVQASSIPFLAVLGFSPVLWTVIAAMTVRGSLMNAGNPIFSAFAMETVEPAERATFSAATSVAWQLGWVVGGLGYAGLQAALGFETGFDVGFLVTIALYSVATALYWIWFGRTPAAKPVLAASRIDG